MEHITLPKPVKKIISALEQNGFEAYAVGGCVRDVMLGREPKDWDITTNARPSQMKAIFHRTIDTGITHGTLTVMMNHVGYEVTTYRIDGDYEDGRHPNNVEFTGDLIEDLKRRDFTINAMAYNEKTGLVDEFCGLEDLKRGMIRCVGDPEDRFHEDALRMMRAVRFAAQLGFQIEENTAAAIEGMAENLKRISRERIREELAKLITSNHPGIIREAYRRGITKYVLPEFDRMMETPQNSPYHMYSVGEHTIKVMESVSPDSHLRWAALLHDVGKPETRTTDREGVDHFHGHEEVGGSMAREILKRLRLDNKTVDTVVRLVRQHDYPLQADEKVIRRSMNRIGTDIYPLLLQLKRGDCMGKSPRGRIPGEELLRRVEEIYHGICAQKQCVTIRELAVNGKDLIELGILPGAKIGTVLENLLELVLDNPEWNTRDVLLEEAAKYK